VSKQQKQNSPIKPSPTSISLDTLLSQQAYITSLNELLKETDDKKALRFCVEEFVPKSKQTSAASIKNNLYQIIANIDESINYQINEIIHHPKFQKLEAAWQGLWLLVRQAEGTHNIKIKMLDINWSEIAKDISRAAEFDHSQLFKKIYSEEFGMPGGEPYGALIGDYEISHRISKKHPHDDIATLTGLAEIAAAAFAPFFAAASSELFGLESFAGLGLPLNLDGIFAQKEYIKWNSLRNRLDARFIALTLPKILLRKAYRSTRGSYKGLYFHEITSQDGSNQLWGNASFAFGIILIREFANVGWFGHIRGVPRNRISGGMLAELPVDYFDTDPEHSAHKPVTDVIITDSVEKDVSELGFIPLCQGYLTPYSAFYNNQSIHRAKDYRRSDVNASAKMSAMMQHVLCSSRFAHYIKVMIRDKVGSFLSAEDCEYFLTNWMIKYTTGNDDLEWDTQARYPIKKSSVKVRDNPAKPGEYLAVIHIQPHYQLDQMVSELELVTELAGLGNK